MQRSGVLSRNGFELRLERINQLSYHQTLVDRIFRTGELLVEMGGETGVVVFDHVPRPAAVQSVITEQINAVHRQPGGAVQAASTSWNTDVDAVTTQDTPPAGTARVNRPMAGDSSIADRLVQLDELRRRGILTDDEFSAKKAELLDRL